LVLLGRGVRTAFELRLGGLMSGFSTRNAVRSLILLRYTISRLAMKGKESFVVETIKCESRIARKGNQREAGWGKSKGDCRSWGEKAAQKLTAS